MSAVEQVRGELRRLIEGRPWIVAMDVLAATTGVVNQLLELGAARVMVIGAYRGVGPLPDPKKVPTILLDLPAADMMGGIHRAEEALGDLPPWARAEVDRFDPDREARVVGALFSRGVPVADRPVWGARPLSWQALEDKTVIDALWDELGIGRAPSEVVPAELGALQGAARRLERGAGTVWVADNRGGFHGAAEGLRWVRDPGGEEGREAALFLSSRADRARVMPFVEGVPCSVHGWVFEAPFADPRGADGAEDPALRGAPFETHTIALRPCEMVVLRAFGSPRLIYAQAATFWDPPAADRAYMRALARRVGDHLRRSLGYRGVFTLDGILSAEGFLPTELNPRFGAALMVMSRSLPELPVYLLHLALAAGEAEVDPLALERLIVEAADANRQGGCTRLLETPIGETRYARLFAGPSGYQVVDDGQERGDEGPCLGTVMAGPHAVGTFIRVVFDPAHVPPGPPVGPRAVAALSAIERAWGLAVGALEAASEARR